MPSLQEFRNNFFGVRPNRFTIEAQWPDGVVSPDLSDLFIYVKAADLPGSTIGTIPIAWQGRIVKFSGERVYTDWAIQVYDSNIPSKDLRTGFERWMEAMNGRNTHNLNYNLTADWVIRYSDISPGSNENEASFNKSVKLKNCFPVDIGAVALNYDLTDSFSEFSVQIAYDYWEPYS